jgi:hypothetical protein
MVAHRSHRLQCKTPHFHIYVPDTLVVACHTIEPFPILRGRQFGTSAFQCGTPSDMTSDERKALAAGLIVSRHLFTIVCA